MQLGELQREPFWIVGSEVRGLSPTPYKHLSQASAFAEAERLARRLSGRFYVMEVQGGAMRTDVTVVRPADKDIPF